MVLGTKSEERIKELLKEYVDERRQLVDSQIANATSGVFLWGLLCGVLAAYTGVWPFLIGATVGYCTAKKNYPVVNDAYKFGTDTVTVGYKRLADFLAEK